ncbi:polyketide synthase protein [Rutstroemia sp. NJR-2017a BBW]|nr:polyketide synthase protein [Rutstroemia sp. NJR-2017a BBW]
MASLKLYVFGDLTLPFEEHLRRLLHTRNNEILQSFFVKISFAFRHEFAKLPRSQQDWFPNFTTLIDLLSKLGQTEGTPALKFALLCATQLGLFIRRTTKGYAKASLTSEFRYYGEGSRPYPTAADSYILGLCTGSFAASAISTSQTLQELIPAAIEAVLVAFRTGLRSLELRNAIELSRLTESQSWSTIFSAKEAEAIELIETFSAANKLSPSYRPYISAVAPSNVTISGRPSILKKLQSESSFKTYSLPINSPYHAPHLFTPSDIDEILGELHDERLKTYKPRLPLLSAASGEIITASSLTELLRKAITDSVYEQIRWDEILEYFEGEDFEDMSLETVDIFPVLSNAAQLISTVLNRSTKTAVSIRDVLNTTTSASEPVRPTGKFEHSNIAITGFSGRFPEAASNEEFWQLLRDGRDVHRTIPTDRFNWKTHFDASGKKKNTSRVQYGCFINEPGLFDARFFNMSPRECQNTDPAQRLAITVTYEAMEMAGMVTNRTPSTQQDRIGVFFGVTSDDWREVNSGQDIDTYFIPGGNRAFVPGRISYFYRFSGPSLSIDTACSSSLAAIQTACTSLWRGDCDSAVAGGTNVLTNPDNFAGLDRGHFLSTTGNCNAFDDGASGYCRADAVGAVILKRLEDAEADGDPIYGVIRGSYTNHCGQTDSITRPHEGDQLSVFQRVMRHADANPLDVGYIEMHGTGTQAGDATEMKSVLAAFVPGHDRKANHPLYIGSAKANVGHAESASGVTSLIKILMMMKMNEIPPHVGIKTKINHNYPLDLEERNVHIARKPVPWRRSDSARGKRAVFLNNFSAAGGNTALLLEDSPIREVNPSNQDSRTVHLVTVTAKTASSLQGNISNLIEYLDTHQVSLPSLSYTTTARRTQHNHRFICSASDTQSLLESLKARRDGPEVKPIPNASKLPKVVLVFTGQGTFYLGMGTQLFKSLSTFKADLVQFDRIAQQHGFPSFLSLVDGTASDIKIEELDPVLTHLAHSCIQMALYRLWKSWGVQPALVIGHSLGEYAALYSAGVLTASDAIYLVGSRAKLLSKYCLKGTHTMLHIKAPQDVIKSRLEKFSAEVACVNQPSGTVVSGPVDEISQLMSEFKAENFECAQLNVPYAFHSAQVDPILDTFEKAASSVHYNAPEVPFASPLLGRIISDKDELGASYLARACRGVVNFKDALEAAMSSSIVNERTLWLEIGPHPLCSAMIKGTLGSQSMTTPSLRKDKDTWRVMTSSIELLYSNGIEIQWDEYHRDFRNSLQVLELPRYSWDLKRYWIDYRNDFCLTKGDVPATEHVVSAPTEDKRETIWISPSVQRVIEEKNARDVSTLLVETNINDPRLSYVIQGHKVNGAALCPSSLYADMAMTVADYMLRANGMNEDDTGIDVGTMKVTRPFIANPNGGAQLLRISATADWSAGTIAISLFSTNNLGKKIADHGTCLSRINALAKGVDSGESHKLKTGMVYKLFSSLVDYDSRYKGIQEVVLDSNELEATARVSFQVGDEGFYFNPIWIDSLGHIAGFIMNGNDNIHSKEEVFVNHGWDAMRCSTKFAKGKTYQTYNRMQLESGTTYVGDTYILDEGVVVAVFEGVRFQGVPRQVLDQLLPSKPRATGSSIVKPVAAEKPTLPKVSTPATQSATKKPSKENTPKPPKPSLKTSNNVVTQVMSIIADEAGIDATALEADSDFADFGIDSLLALTISGRLLEELGIELQSTMFAEYPTVKELTTFLNRDSGYSSPAHPTSDEEPEPAEAAFDSASSYASSVTSVGSDDEDVMAAIRSIVAEETGVAASEITNSTVLAELGMDSLLALTIMSKLMETLDMELPSTLFAECDTLKEVEEALGLAPKNSEAKLVVNGTTKTSTNAASTGKSSKLDDAKATSVLLQGNVRTSSKTLFLFPDGSGSATSYASIPRISPDVAVYGLNCPWMKTPHNMVGCSLEDMVSVYLKEIRRRQPHGPYYFGGWSAGGILAYEAAQQLAKASEETASLILIDSPNPVGLENPPQRMYDFFESVGIFGTNGKAPPEWLRPHFDAFIGTLDGYEVKPFTGSSPLNTHIIYARDGICKLPSDPRPEVRPDDPREMLWLLNNRTDFSGAGWAELVGKENLKVEVLDNVNHFSMVETGPKIAELASFVGAAMG